MKKYLCGYDSGDRCARVISQNKDCITYCVENDDGELQITEYYVFPGIWLIYKDAHTRKFKYPPFYPSGLLEINHCRQGRFEYAADDRFFHLAEGDMSINKSLETAEVYCPTEHYHGITIVIDPKLAPHCLSCLLDDVDVVPDNLLKKFCGENKHFIMRSTAQLEHIFSELYSVQDIIRNGYNKVKILELFLFLSVLDPALSQEEQHSCSKAQEELARAVCSYISSHMDVRLTIEQLAARFYVSPAQLKKCFYSVYGESTYAYIKSYKMHQAAQCLKNTDLAISEIAHNFGYDNNSKFANAFRNIMGMSPTEYRQGSRDTYS